LANKKLKNRQPQGQAKVFKTSLNISSIGMTVASSGTWG
jgi:hypothetical protein